MKNFPFQNVLQLLQFASINVPFRKYMKHNINCKQTLNMSFLNMEELICIQHLEIIRIK